MRPEVVFAYVRDLVEQFTGQRPIPDHDGDLPVHLMAPSTSSALLAPMIRGSRYSALPCQNLSPLST